MAAPPKRCYYEVLGLPRDCTPEDIKLAFRRLALALHPDKQPPGSDLAAATAAFQELQHAHSVLSDPSERAYYDSHRSQILFSSTSSGGGNAAFAGGVDLFAYFSSSAFSGFSDFGRGFYKVYGDVFSKVYSQELAYARRLGINTSSIPPPPVIGNLDSPYTQVLAFYNYWLGFSTIMDFAWAGEWDAASGPNRRSRRLMEEENKKASKKARREYNDAVRGLAAFAKKRDKRVVDMVLKKKAEEEKRRNEEKERKKEEERKKKERAMAYVEPEWARVNEGDDYGVLDEEEEEDRARKKEELYCVACNKKFKSDKQWKNHEQSKKHRDKVAELRMAFKEEEEEEVLKEEKEAATGVGGDWEDVDVGFDFKPAQESDESDWTDAAEELSEEFRDGLELRDEGDGDKDLDEGDQVVGSYDEASVLEAMVSGRKNGKSDYVIREEASLSDDEDEQSSQMRNARRKGRRRRASKRGGDEDVNADAGRGEKGEVQPEESELHNQEQDADEKMEGPSSLNDEAAAQSKGDQHGGRNQNLKKNKKDKKEAGKKGTASDQKNSSKGKKQKDISKTPSNDCDTCGQSFDSRNKLFAHLGDTGHAMLKTRQKNR